MDSSTGYSAAKQAMLSQQLIDRGITDPRVLRAMARVPRERFLPVDMQRFAYADNALGIDCEQTISQPYIVALMTEALDLTGDESVLEIGTGSGYQTAVLAELAHDVVTIERHTALAKQAAIVLEELGFTNVAGHVGDGTLGWPARAPYDRVIVTAAAEHVPPLLFEQLREGGILVIPVGDLAGQVLEQITKINGQPRVRRLSGCRFVPLIGREGWPEASGG
ncbi:MAG: protein-L-isoaspartate(D-aspartate) O-methyltransferase [Pirellulales bacterium]|nr:protein-L-isoaspartate(D-aspartate) O-methyltransferase [Pirellulales bacterium]